MKAREKALFATTIVALAVFFLLFAVSCLGHFLRRPAPQGGTSLADKLDAKVFTEAATVTPQPSSRPPVTPPPNQPKPPNPDPAIDSHQSEHAERSEDDHGHSKKHDHYDDISRELKDPTHSVHE